MYMYISQKTEVAGGLRKTVDWSKLEIGHILYCPVLKSDTFCTVLSNEDAVACTTLLTFSVFH